MSTGKRKRLNTTLGFYSPSFLRMHVGTNKSLQNLNTLNDPYWEAIYLHEYVHFIQDVTTAYGLANIGIITDYMRFVNNDVLKSSPGPFQVPVLPVPNGSDNVDANLRLQRAYNGTGEDDNVTLLAHSKAQHTVSSASRPLPLDLIEVSYRDSSGSAQTFEFGGLCVVESMAYLVERACYPSSPASPDLPYSSAEKLVQLIHPPLAADPLNILALCDVSLMQYHPGFVFYETLIRIKTQGITITKPEDLYGIAMSTINPWPPMPQATAHAISKLRGYFNHPFFDPVKDWIDRVFNNALAVRQNNPTFVLDLARGGPLANNPTFRQFLTNVGTPLVTNALDDATLHDPFLPAGTNPHYSLLWAIDQVHSIFWGSQTSCAMVGHCCAGKIAVDSRCSLEPWERAADTSPCPFGQVWAHWGLTGYYPS